MLYYGPSDFDGDVSDGVEKESVPVTHRQDGHASHQTGQATGMGQQAYDEKGQR